MCIHTCILQLVRKVQDDDFPPESTTENKESEATTLSAPDPQHTATPKPTVAVTPIVTLSFGKCVISSSVAVAPSTVFRPLSPPPLPLNVVAVSFFFVFVLFPLLLFFELSLSLSCSFCYSVWVRNNINEMRTVTRSSTDDNWFDQVFCSLPRVPSTLRVLYQ